MTTWKERFEEGTDPPLRKHGDSFPFDRRLLPEEIEASIAHARALCRAKVITAAERDRLVRALRAIGREHRDRLPSLQGGHEDVHSFVEAALGEKVGPLAGKLHTARSRNDQVATIYRMWLRRRIDGDLAALRRLVAALVKKARAHPEALLPAYTHLQRAQPVLLAHHLLARAEAFLRDRERLHQARRRVNVLPLGAGAGTGVGFPLDRRETARELGFSGVARNSLDAVSDSDFLLDYLSAAANLGTHLSGLAEEVGLWPTAEDGFGRLSDRAATGSSIMPQKRNPDGAELVRGKAGRLTGHLVAMLTTLKALPLSYHKDLQEGGPAILDAAETVRAALDLLAVTVESLAFDPERMRAALEGGFAEATELADWLVRRGVPFREAHGTAARLVREAETRGLSRLADLPPEVLEGAHPALDAGVLPALSPEAAVRARDVIGGTAPRRVKAELRRMERILARW